MSERTILITGATGKIGGVLVENWLRSGDYVVAVGRSQEKLESLVERSLAYGDRLSIIQMDLIDADVGAKIKERLRGLSMNPSCLVNNARNQAYLMLRDDGLVERQQFVDEFTLDVVVAYELTMALTTLPKSKLKTIVNIGSQYGVVAPNLELYRAKDSISPLHYGVAKAALAQLTRELAVRLSSRGIRVNCVAYGGIEGRTDEGFRERYAKLCPLGRMLNKSDLAGPVDLLLSESSAGMTGQVLLVDGGWTIW